MRILQVNDYRAGGGAEVVVDETVRLLEARGHEVERFTGEDVPGGRRPWTYVASRPATAALSRRIEAFRPDVVHFHNVYHLLSPSVLAARSAPGSPRPRRVLTAHDFHLVCPNSGACWFDRGGARHLVEPDRLRSIPYLLGRRWDHRSASHGALKLLQHLWGHRLRRHRERLDAVLCPGPAAAAVLRTAGVTVPVHAVANPFDAAEVQSTARASLGDAPRWPSDTAGGPRPLRLVFVGRVEREKGLAELLEAWPAEASAESSTLLIPELLVIGGGDDLERCVAIADRRGLSGRIHFAGPQPRARALAAICAADALVMPSRTPEVAPMVLFEALAFNTAIIATAFGAMREALAVTDRGFPVDPMDAEALPGQLAAVLAECAAGVAPDVAPADRAGTRQLDAFLAARRPDRYAAMLEAIYAGDDPATAT